VPNTRSIPASSQAAPSQKTLLDFKQVVAAPVGASDSPDSVRALDAIHMSLDWLMEYNWTWYILNNLTFATVANTATYTITPQNGGIREIQNMRVSSGTQRPIVLINESFYNRVVYDQSATGLPSFYSLSKLGQEQLVTLHPTPDRAETVSYDAYTEPVKATSDSSRLLLPSWLEAAFILRAQALVAEWRRSPSERLFILAEAARNGAAARDRAPEDLDVRFISFEEHSTPHRNLNVAPSDWDY
jgi:hypothetical protein